MKKIIKIIFSIFIFLLIYNVCLAASSSNYQIWIDTLGSGGGRSASGNYQIDSNISIQTGDISESANFREKTAFYAIEAEPTVGFNIQSVALNFGQLSKSSTAYSSHTFSAYTNAKSGYTIRVYGQPLNNGDYTIQAIGVPAVDSKPGTEQFGMNLVANAVPIVGENPSGGIGQAAENYNIANKFSFQEGDVIAYAESFTYQTDYTVSVIVNINEQTPAGFYNAILTYEFIPVF